MEEKIKSINWMLNEYDFFNLSLETLCLAMQIYDRFIYINLKNINNIFITVASLFIACKYEEVNPPSLLQFLKNKKTYIKDIIKIEREILCTLEHRFSLPTIIIYLQEYIGNNPILYKKCYKFFIYNLNNIFLLKKTEKQIAYKIYQSIVLQTKKIEIIEHSEIIITPLKIIRTYVGFVSFWFIFSKHKYY